MVEKMVAYLEVRRAGRNSHTLISIQGNEQFFLGRNESLCRYIFPDPVISNKHLQIHCIIYEQDPESDIAPFVYATDLSSNGTWLKKANKECSSSQGCGPGIRMRANDKFLLDDGDELSLAGGAATLVFYSKVQVPDVSLTQEQNREKQLFADRYLITGRALGEGGYGRVMVGIDQATQQQLACKIIDLTKLWPRLPKYKQCHEQDPKRAKKTWPESVSKAFREFEVLKDLSHPNIIAVRKVFWSSNSIYIFQDLIAGGDLFSYQEYKGGQILEDEAAAIIHQIVIGVEYLHRRGIVHRDLKPENILISSLDGAALVIITDFGNARYLPSSQTNKSTNGLDPQRMHSVVGTVSFAAPEIYRKNKTIAPHLGYSKMVDMWSIGAITIQILSGEVPFAGPYLPRSDPAYNDLIRKAAARCDLSFLDDEADETWATVGSRPKNFIRKLVALKESDRMTATEALRHPWFFNGHYRRFQNFEALYQKSIRGWKSRCADSQLVESIWDLAPDIYEQSSPHERALSQELVARYFSPAGKSSNHDKRKSSRAFQFRRSNGGLSSVSEAHKDYGQSRQRFMESSNSVERTSIPETSLEDSMEQLSFSIENDGRYRTDDVAQINASPAIPDESYEVPAVSDSICQFSLPPPPPETPCSFDRSQAIATETPTRPVEKYYKRPAVSPLDGSHECGRQPSGKAYGQNSAAASSREMAKRRKLSAQYR